MRTGHGDKPTPAPIRSGTREDPITHGGQIRTYQWCKCHVCGRTSVCTPSNDYYTRSQDGPTGQLVCYPCLCAGRR